MTSQPEAIYRITIQDAGDGSGDFFIPIPDELLHMLGWRQGDWVEATKLPNDNILISKSAIHSKAPS